MTKIQMQKGMVKKYDKRNFKKYKGIQKARDRNADIGIIRSCHGVHYPLSDCKACK